MALISPREIFIQALKQEAAYIVLLHNHPSGDPTPSEDDIRITNRITKAAMLLEFELVDHIIIGDCAYYSYKEHKRILY